ncbi:MAG: hypothetical protein O6705_03780 [Actinobacteria bacterium]|nr:hypothetical protein [Actinomycetota bacterium]
MKLRIFAVVAALSLLFGAGIASANGGDGGDGEGEGDTLFNFGYDAQARLFLFNTQATDSSPYDCTLENGSLTAMYGTPDGGDVIPVDELRDSDRNIVTFEPTEFDLEVTPATTDFIEYPGPENECHISAYAFGDQDHINHGQFMKLFNSLIDMRGRGCLNRWLAQSNLGKEDLANDDPGITFTTALATCDHGRKDKGEDHPGNGHGNKDKDEDHPGRGQGNGHQDEPDEADEGKGAGHGRPGSPGRSNDAHERRDK